MKVHVEVYLAARRLAALRETFTVSELEQMVGEMFGDCRPSVQAHVSSLCVANVPKTNGTAYNYLWRLDQGKLRLFDPRKDRPHATRWSAADRPREADVEPSYRSVIVRHPQHAR